ncbi:unnamed protein product [Rodentolepis nana]|uniref:phospholipase A2 n=1 Tax=Rodentolepis nana TaxID=102285 RepID=A0A0R3TVN7_RODNA|nr:unnamed protein product [Rodentolepis nana]
MFNHLLELGADPNLRNSEGRTVLHQAVESQELDTVVQLLIHAADTNLADKRGIYPLHLAVAKCLDVHIVYALIVFEANVNATDGEGLSPRHWLCHHESGIDKILYALDVVQAKRCPLGQANCTSGCISPLSVSRKQSTFTGGIAGDEAQNLQTSLEPSRSKSFSYLTQLLQDTPFASALCRSTDDLTVAELFNGTPPDPVLSNTNLTQDLDNDLFLYLAGRGSPSSSSRCTSPRKRSSAPEVRPSRGFDSSIMSTVREEVDLESQDSSCSPSNIESPPPETVEFPVNSTCQDNQPGAEERCSSPTTAQKTTDSWFRRTVLSRFLSTVMPGLDSLMMTDVPTVPIIEGVDAPPNCPDEEERMNNGCLESDPSSVNSVIVPPCVNISNPRLAGIPEIQGKQDIHQQEDQHSESTDTFHTVENQNSHDDDHVHQWSRSIDGCSGLPGVPCCLERNALSLAAQHEGVLLVVNGISHTSLPTANLKNLCEPSTASSSRSSSLNNLQRDPEGFRVSRRGYRVLCLDGGGIRGLVLCQVLRAIERAAGRPIRDLYDWIIGTSTGAMLALNLVQGKCVRYNRCLYFRMKEKIFVGNRPYPTEGLESLLREEFGETPVMTDIPDVRVSVTALRGDHFPPRLHMFRNYPAPYEKMERLVSELMEAKSTPITADSPPTAPSGKLVAHSSSSTSNLSTATAGDAPTKINTAPTSLSGSDNSLSTDASYKRLLVTCLHDLLGDTAREVGRNGDDESDLQETIVSMLSSFSRRYVYTSKGTNQIVPNSEVPVWRAARASGAAPSYFRACGPYLDGGLISNNPTIDLLTESQELNIVRRLRLDVFRPQNMSEAYRVALGVTELSRMLVEMATMSEGRVVERSRAWCNSLGIPFFRFSPLLCETIALDTKNERPILQMLWETEAYLCNCQDRILKLVDSLLGMPSDAPTSSSHSDTPEELDLSSKFSF